MNRLIVVGSPRANGRSAALADQLFEACIEDCPNDEVALAPVSTLDIAGCTGCNFCRDGEALADFVESAGGGDAGGEKGSFRCSVRDDMDEVYPLIDAADELVVVSPVYFAGAPSQLKALLDRLQPYFWTDARNQQKRPAVLHVVGEGGDPHGFAPLVGAVRSALAVAGFQLETVYDWVGKIDESGEITAEADVVELDNAGSNGAERKDFAPAFSEGREARAAEASEGEGASVDSPAHFRDGAYAIVQGRRARKSRAKLQLNDKQVSSFSEAEGGKASKSASARSARGGGAKGNGACVGKGKSDGNAHGGAGSRGSSGRSRKAKGNGGRSRRA